MMSIEDAVKSIRDKEIRENPWNPWTKIYLTPSVDMV